MIIYLLENWKFFLYVLLAILVAGFLVIRKVNFATEGQDGKINEVEFNNSSEYNGLCLPITGRPCTDKGK